MSLSNTPLPRHIRMPEGVRASERTAAWALTLALLVLAGCANPPAGSPSRGPSGSVIPTRPAPGADGPPEAPGPDPQSVPDAEPRIEPVRSGGPNKPYAVAGQSYVPVARDEPIVETGVASWYGKKFHGRRTASGEVYNMHAMTAAHKTMPIPSFARVRNPANGREVIVRINDRGPFVAGRIIDLSYAAAMKLGTSSLAKVEVSRLTHDDIRALGGSDTRLARASTLQAAAPASPNVSRPGRAGAPLVAARSAPADHPVLPSPSSDTPAERPAVAAATPVGPAGLPPERPSDAAASPLSADAAAGAGTAVTTPVLPSAPAIVMTPAGVAAAPGSSSTPEGLATSLPSSGSGVRPSATAAVANPAGVSPSVPGGLSVPAEAQVPGPSAGRERAYTQAASGFWLQLGAFGRSEGALDFHQKLSHELDWLAPLLAVFVDGALHRLQAGPFASRELALESAGRVREAVRLAPMVIERR